MRPINSPYDRESIRAATAAHGLAARYLAGETISYDEVEALGDMGLADLEREVGRLREHPGTGYALDGEV